MPTAGQRLATFTQLLSVCQWLLILSSRICVCVCVCVCVVWGKETFATYNDLWNEKLGDRLKFVFHYHLIIMYHLTASVGGAPQIISQPLSSFSPCSPLPSGTWRAPGLSIPRCCLPTSSSVSALSSPPFHCALHDGFGQTWWTGDTTIPLQFASLYDGQEVSVWSDCLLDLGTDFRVGNIIFVWDA